MKAKILLLMCLIATISTRAQLTLGDAVVTKSQFNTSAQCVQIFPVGNTTSSRPLPQANPGDNWGVDPTWQTNILHQNWTPNNLGQVFGIAINTQTTVDPRIYVSVTQIYPRHTTTPASYQGTIAWIDYFNENPMQSMQGATLIWDLNPAVGAPLDRTSLVRLTHTETFTPDVPLMFNHGTGIGNICYDKDHNQIFATNFEDGRIYRIDVTPGSTYGNVLSRYDPFTTYACPLGGCPTAIPTFVDLGQRLWGIAYNDRDKRLYFSVWNGDYDNPGTNTIYSIPINGTSGEFDSPSQTQPVLKDWIDPTLAPSIPVIPMPVIIPTLPFPWPSDVYYYSNPVSDIEFSIDGNTMLVAERSMGEEGPMPPSWDPDYNYDRGWSHRSRVLSYSWNQTLPTCSTGPSPCNAACPLAPAPGWSPTIVLPPYWYDYNDCWSVRQQNQYNVGNWHSPLGHPTGDDWEYWGHNASGGTDFGYVNVEAQSVSSCDKIVWATGDALESHDFGVQQGFPGGDNESEFIYGLTGMPIAGNFHYQEEITSPPFTPHSFSVGENSIYHSIFGPPSPGIGQKDYSGDVDVFRTVCCDLAITHSSTNVTCINGAIGNNGTITLNTINGGGGPPYTIVWSNGAPPGTQNLTGLAASTYTVTVSGSICSTTLTFIITAPPSMAIGGIVTPPCTGPNSGSINITVTSGTSPFTYEWNTTPVQTSPTATNLAAGTYTVTVTDANQCTASASFTVAECCLVVADLEIDPDSICVGEEYTLTASGGVWGWLGRAGDPLPVYDLNASPADWLGFPITGTHTETVRAGMVPGTEEWCLIVYSANPNTNPPVEYCSNTECDEIVVVYCHECPAEVDLAIGQPDDQPPVADPPGVRLTFKNVGADEPTFITWTVDGVVIGQTTGYGEIQHTFTEGTHVVCMEAAFVYPHDGHSECCYYDVCEVLHIRGCELWKAIDRITPTIPNINFPRTVFFDYEGFTGDATWNLTIIWNFGDGTTAVSSGSDPDYTYTYATAGDYNWCATMVWSIGPWDGSNPGTCCCVDSICDTVTAGPCGPVQFDYEMTYYSMMSQTSYSIVPTNLPPFYSVRWTHTGLPPNTVVSPTLNFFNPNPIPTEICAELLYNDAALVCSTAKVCHPIDPGGTINDVEGVISSSRLIGYYPNPTSGDLIVEFMAEPGEKAAIEITDYLGQLLLVKNYDNLNDGNNRLDLNIGDLASGLYQMKIIVGAESKVVKVVKY